MKKMRIAAATILYIGQRVIPRIGSARGYLQSEYQPSNPVVPGAVSAITIVIAAAMRVSMTSWLMLVCGKRIACRAVERLYSLIVAIALG